MIQWVYSKVQYFEEYISKWYETLIKEGDVKDELELVLRQLDGPLGFIS